MNYEISLLEDTPEVIYFYSRAKRKLVFGKKYLKMLPEYRLLDVDGVIMLRSTIGKQQIDTRISALNLKHNIIYINKVRYKFEVIKCEH